MAGDEDEEDPMAANLEQDEIETEAETQREFLNEAFLLGILTFVSDDD